MKYRRLLWLFISGVTAVTLLVAAQCAPAAPLPTPTAAPAALPPTPTTAPAAPTPKAAEGEVTIVYVTPALALTMDPSFVPDEHTGEIMQNLYGQWTYYGEVEGPEGIMADDTGGGEAAIKPGLFESWEISEDGKVYTMHLRKNIVDSFGNQLKAEDAKWIFDRMRKVGAGSVYIVDAMNVTDPDQVRVIDDYTLEFRLPSPSPIFLRVLTVVDGSPFGAATARQQATTDDPWATEWLKTHAPATGPYMLESWTPGVEQVLVKNPNYFGPKPAIDRIIYRQVPESASRVALLLGGKADIARDLDMDEIARIEEAPGAKAVCYAGNKFTYVGLNWENEPTNNLKLRQALAYAVPYEDIWKSVYKGLAKPFYGYVTDNVSDFLGKDAYPYRTDYEKAKALLKEAGYSGGLDLPLLISEANPEHQRIAVLLKDSFAKIGVNLSIDLKPAAAWKDLVFNRKFITQMNNDYSFVLDPDYQALVWLIDQPPPNWNSTGFRDAEFTELMNKAKALPDGPERAKLNKRMQERFYELTPWLSLANIPTCYGMLDKISGWAWHTNDQVMFYELQAAR
jgi:peptide/nickel transport system substrate-binding protein